MRETFGTNPATSATPYNDKHLSFTGSDGGTNGEKFSNLSTHSNLSGHADLINDNYCPGNCNFQLPVEHIDIWILN